MPLIERQSLGSSEAKADDVPITYFLTLDEMRRANIVQFIDISLPPNTVLSSVQTRQLALEKPAIVPTRFSSISPSIPTQAPGPFQLNGIQLPIVLNWFTSSYTFSSVTAAISAYGSATTQDLLGSIPIDARRRQGNIYQYSDGSLHYIVAYRRPVFTFPFNSLGQMVNVWYPYRIVIEATGYVLGSIPQQPVEEEVACVVIDRVSQSLYGVRVGKEEQSDFIETQRQACRVGEAILHQANLVRSVTFTVPYNPGIKRGQTLKVTNADRGVDVLGLVKNVTHEFNTDASGNTLIAVTRVDIRAGEYIFRSGLGEKTPDERTDLRQT